MEINEIENIKNLIIKDPRGNNADETATKDQVTSASILLYPPDMG